ncbi:C40 family peptidase [Pedobacter punctiformis]|uniref:SH3 domain-containing C40 family peptidase n=1 Tax=Pedobacter punctiformis TaxID=3004097 RepID=A0ABT4L9B9_9SPHI|nr:SH3 domain-containing C40 family peptidase [Pedobacter sp. HCMS5-2]MCZ4244506.1 SH3 domain-containing C40 family peptidase [Pedobacter sp. HCMS5-2]
MKRIFIVFLVLLFSAGLKAQTDTTLIKTIAKQVQKEYAPDKRSVYFSVQIKGDSVLAESTSAQALQEFSKQTKDINGLKNISQLLPAKALNGFEYGLANLSVCNNRAFPQNSAEMMTQMILGTPVQVLKKQAGYYLVRTPDGYISWTDGTAVSLMDKQAFETWKRSKRVIYAEDFGHAFSKPDVTSDRVSDVVKGNILVLGGEEKGFYKLIFPDQRIGYIKKTEALLLSEWEKKANPGADAILKTAKTLIGVPYLWGGTSIKGVDCSGFTKTSYFLNGIIIPRDASQQALIGEQIDVLENDSISVAKCLKNLLPGDLMFFSAAKRKGINGGRVTHTAIYMGNGAFIQAAGMVRINSIVPDAPNYDEHQSLTLVGARRLLTNIGKAEITRVDQHEWYGTKL